ncbi:MAG: TRAP transporter small permease subunit [Betaproteobacteria bacterium]|nr:TRAP transporter small permease subunit [Betaproteobacteria bacterium]
MARFLFSTVPEWILGALILAGIAINFAGVVSRYAFGKAIFWSEEVLVFMTIWGVFVGLAAIAYRGEHLNMDLFSSRIEGIWKLLLNGLIAITLLACCGFMVVQSWTIVSLFAQTGPVSIAAGIPKVIPHAALLIGFFLTALAVLVRIRSYLSGRF